MSSDSPSACGVLPSPPLPTGALSQPWPRVALNGTCQRAQGPALATRHHKDEGLRGPGQPSPHGHGAAPLHPPDSSASQLGLSRAVVVRVSPLQTSLDRSRDLILRPILLLEGSLLSCLTHLGSGAGGKEAGSLAAQNPTPHSLSSKLGATFPSHWDHGDQSLLPHQHRRVD